MNCIKMDLIQKYIDKAASEKEIDTVRKHLAVCRECTARLTAVQQRADVVKKALNILSDDEIPIPGFITPVGISKTLEAPRMNRYVVNLFAASVMICVVIAVIFTMKTKTQQQLVVVHTVGREINANQTVAKQQMVINIIDANGKITTYP
jgi:hypothetical protein